MTTANKYNTDPKTLQKFVNRANKKDSFARWFQKNGAI